MARPRVYDDATRRELVRAAGQLLATRGPASLSVRAVADAVGATTTAIYGLFGSKAELLRAVYVAGFERLDSELRAVPRSDEPLVDLLGLGLAYRRSALAEPHLYGVMFGAHLPGFEPDPDDAALALGTLEVLRDTVRRTLATGALPDHLDVEDVTLGLWAQVHGLASLELAGALGDRGEPFWREQLGTFAHGLRTRTTADVSGPG